MSDCVRETMSHCVPARPGPLLTSLLEPDARAPPPYRAAGSGSGGTKIR
jgi:hypothetical protein